MSEEEVESAGGSGGKMLLIVGLLLGVIGGGGGMFVFLGSGGDQVVEAIEEEIEEPAPEVPENLVPLDFERMTVPIHVMQNGRWRFLGNYFVHIRMLFIDEQGKVRAERSEDLLRQGFLSAISKSNLAVEGSRDQIDIDKLSQILLDRAKKIVGSDTIYDLTVIKATRFRS